MSSSDSCWSSFKKALNDLRVDDLSDQNTNAQNLYDTTDDWDASSLLGRAYTVYHPLEPRALIWYFLITLPIIIAAVVAFIDQSLTALFRLKHDYVAHRMSDWVDGNGGKLLLCAVAWGVLTSALLGLSYLWSRKIAHGTAGRGMPRVVASLNGVYMPHWGHFRILISKIITVIITVVSGVPYDFVGSINEIGAMVGACSLSRNPVYEKVIPFAKYFRNGRDSRLIIAVGIATAATAAFKSPIGGLALLLELSAVKFNIKFLYRVFLACNICGFVGQLIYTHVYGFQTRHSTGGWDMLPLQQLAQIQENLLVVIPAIVLGVIGGLFQGIFAMMSNFILNRPALRSIEALLIVAFVYGFAIFTLAGIFGMSDECRPLVQPNDTYLTAGTPVFLHSAMFCDQNKLHNTSGTSADDTIYVNAFASLTLGFDSSILRILFRRRIPSFWSAAELATAAGLFSLILPFLTVLSVVDGDVLMPTGLLGGCVGQLLYVIIKAWGIDTAWFDGGLFALLGAVSFISGMTRLTFSLVFLFVDFAGDVRHVLFIMLAVSVARAVADWVAPVRIDYVVMKYQGFAILDFALKIEQYDSITLHEFQSRNLKVIPPACTVAQLIRLLTTSFHNSFPVIDPQSQRFIGLVHRRTLQLIVWGFSENIPAEFRHPEQGWPGLVPEGVAASLITKHAYTSAAATHSSALLSFKIEKPTAHLPRGQYESFFSDEQLLTRDSTNNNNVEPGSPTASVRVDGVNSARVNAAAATSSSRPTATHATLEEKEQALRRMLEDYDHFDAHIAAEEFHRLRDLDDWLHVKFSEDDAELLQTTRGIKPERSVMHGAFVEETNKFSDSVLNTQVNLVRYADRAAFTVRAAMCISRLYNMFTVLGLRNAVIVDYNNRPTGVITRRDLMTYQIVKKKKRQEEEGIYGGGIITAYSDEEEDDEDGASTDVPISRGASVQSLDGAETGRKPSVSSKKNLHSGGAAAAPMSYNKGLTQAAGRFFDEESPAGRKNNNNKKNKDASPITTQSSLPSQNNNNNNGAYGSTVPAEESPVPKNNNNNTEENAPAGGGGNESDTASLLPSSRSSVTGGSIVEGGTGDDEFRGRILYTVNRMRPPMLLPKGWNGSGIGSPQNNNNGNNRNHFTTTHTGSSGRSPVVNDNNNDDDHASNLSSAASYSTIVSDPGSQ